MILESRGEVAYFLKKCQPVEKWLLVRVAYKTYRVGRDNLYTRFSGPFLSGVFGVLRHPQFFRYAV